ncbi:MAG: 2OG-Fe(II) oxygenase, partial [Bdellovibrionales bacterium]
VKNQYRFLRTPAYHFFKGKDYINFHSQLVQWGRENLGCHDVSPPWLSYYVEGMEQKPHSDVPHGPWAWVYSLSPKSLQFEGGETFIFKPELLNYWKNFAEEKNREQEAYMDFISPKFNRLVVFDPRFPHGVTQVKGVEDPLEARLVIHGWFVEPRPYVVGGLSPELVQEPLAQFIHNLSDFVGTSADFHGTMSVRVLIQASGEVKQVKWLTNTLLSLSAQDQDTQQLMKWMTQKLKIIRFPKAKKTSSLTVPVLFK